MLVRELSHHYSGNVFNAGLLRAYRYSVFLCCLLFLADVSADDYENYLVIDSNQLLSSDYLSSTYHRVESIDIQNGFYEFIIESDIGNYNITSLALFKKYVDEIKTVSQALDQFAQQDNDFSEELRSQLSVSGDSAVDIITSPFSTASQLAGQIAENLDATLAGEDPFVRNSRNGYSYAEPNEPTIALHKRNVAFQLGLDIYSSNANVQSFLNKVANARAAGRISAGVGFNNTFGRLANKNQLDLKIINLLKNRSISELTEYHVDSLLKLGIKKKLIQQFKDNAILSPTHKTIIVTYLAELNNVSRLDSYIELVSLLNDELGVLEFVQLAKMLSRYHSNIAPLSVFYIYKGQAAAITNARHIVLFETVDLLIWSKDKKMQYARSAEHAKKVGYKAWELVLPGKVSNLASTNLDKLAYKKHPRFLEEN